MYKHPGVYVEHVPSGALSIEAASTSIACFIGDVPRGPIGEPVSSPIAALLPSNLASLMAPPPAFAITAMRLIISAMR